MKQRFRLAVSAVLFLLLAAGVVRAEVSKNLLIVVDSSSSMAETTPEGMRRYEVVRESIGYLAESLSGDINLGMIAFGHRSREKYGKDDIEMIIPIGPLDPDVVKIALKVIRPKGLSPLAASLRKAADWLANVEGRSCILLVTDGKENCDGDPVETARQIRKEMGVNIVIDVVGLNIPDIARPELEGIASSGGGKLRTADDEAGMKNVLVQTVSQRQGFYKAEETLPHKRFGKVQDAGDEEPSGGDDVNIGREIGQGKVVIHYTNTRPKGIRIFDQDSDEEHPGGGTWTHFQNMFKTSLPQGVYRFVIDQENGLEPLTVKNVVIKADRETSVNID